MDFEESKLDDIICHGLYYKIILIKKCKNMEEQVISISEIIDAVKKRLK